MRAPPDDHAVLEDEEIIDRFRTQGFSAIQIRTIAPSLEDVFVALSQVESARRSMQPPAILEGT